MRLIDADALIEALDSFILDETTDVHGDTVREILERQPTIEERKKGKWIKGIGENGVTTSLFCSCCYYENTHWDDWNYCPNCGARMER